MTVSNPSTSDSRDPHALPADKLAWFRNAKLGLFVHFGCYAVPARGEQLMRREQISLADYQKFAEAFDPSAENIRSWGAWAAENGYRYVTMTTRHHDGYCLWGSKFEEFNSVDVGPKRDLVAEFVEGMRQANLPIGLYYSLPNWRNPAYWEPENYPDQLEQLVEQVHRQVEELMTNYGKIDILWYDIPRVPSKMDGQPIVADPAEFWRSEMLNARVRELQPSILINDRSGLPEDFDTPEQFIPQSKAIDDGGIGGDEKTGSKRRYFETCMTINTRPGWSYHKYDLSCKTTGLYLYNLIEAVRNGGNFIANVGPMADGSFAPEHEELLRAVGQWVKANGEAIYGCEIFEPDGIPELQSRGYYFGMWTRKKNVAYLIMTRWPETGPIAIPSIATRVVEASYLLSGEPIKIQQDENDRLILFDLPPEPPEPLATTLKFEFAEQPQIAPSNGAKWL